MGPSSYVQAVGSLRTCCLLRLSAPARGRLATAAASFGAKSALFRNLAPLLRVVGRRHRIIAREVPLGTIFIGRHVMIGCKMPPQHRHFFPVLEADDVIGLYRCADRNSGFLFDLGSFDDAERSEERRVGKECVSTCKSGWSP